MGTHHIEQSVWSLVIPEIIKVGRSVFKHTEFEVLLTDARRKIVSFVVDTSVGGSVDKYQFSVVISERWHRWSPAMITRKLVRDTKYLRQRFVEEFGDTRFRFAHTVVVLGRFTRGVWRAIKEYNAGRQRYEPVSLGYLVRRFAPELYWTEKGIDWDTKVIFLDITEFLRRARVSIENARRYIHVFFLTFAKALRMMASFFLQRAQALQDRLMELGIDRPYGVFRRKIALFRAIAEAIQVRIDAWIRYARAKLLDEAPSEATVSWEKQRVGPPIDEQYEIVEDEEAEEPYEVVK